MDKKKFTMILAVAVAWIGVAALLTGIFRDQKSFYLTGAVCMLFTSIILTIANRSILRIGK